jgi:hypothetical protein
MNDKQLKIYKIFMHFLKKHDFDLCDRANKLLQRSFELDEENLWAEIEL